MRNGLLLDKKESKMNLNVNISVISIGKKFVAVTKLGGFTIRGKSADTEVLAVRNLFFSLQSNDYAADDDAMLGIELALSGSTIETALIDASTSAK